MAANISQPVGGGKFSFRDLTSDITNEMAERKNPSLHTLEFGLDYILNHLDRSTLWPRTIHTHLTQRPWQVLVYSRGEALARFDQARGLDCRINAYPDHIEWKGLNRQTPNFIFIDLDLGSFKSRLALDRALAKTLRNINEKFNTAVTPTVLWSGNGYHIYLPVEAFILEEESEFERFGNPSRKFIQFAESYLSNNKSDPEHSRGLSFKNCMIRIPGSFNSKNGKQEEVRIVHKWNGSRPSIKPLLYRFDLYLLTRRSKELHDRIPKHQRHDPVFSANWRSGKKE